MKEKIAAVIGAASASLGAAGIAIAQAGICLCVLALITSVLGIISLFIGFLSNNSIYFITAGAALLVTSFIIHKKKCVCHVHRKR